MTALWPRKICAVTGSRADYGLLYWILWELNRSAAFELQLAVTGMHLSPEFGLTVRAIEEDGFDIAVRVETLLSGDTPQAIGKSIGLGVIGFSDALARLQPDLLLVLGDRYEIFAAAQAAMIARIPVAHIAGGDLTEGAYDEAMRHSITKMAHLHFASNAASARRLRQLGEDPARVFDVGSTALDMVRRARLMDRSELERDLGFAFQPRNLLVTFHPATLEDERPAAQFTRLLEALDELGDQVGLLFTKSNSDSDGRILAEMIDTFVRERPHAIAFTSLGQIRYLSLMAQVDAVVGNSSSGLFEAPAFATPTVNIGARQQGRPRAASVIDCPVDSRSIRFAIEQAFASGRREVANPYGDGRSAERILSVLVGIEDYRALLIKRFFDVESAA